MKIYFWQGAAFILRFLSMFIVVPYLTKEPSIYGIYSICISVTIFLNYADLGFLSAGQKYAAECCSRNERTEEMKYIGFGTFVLLIFASLCVLIFLYLGFNPKELIKGLDTQDKTSIASSLLFILAGFTPVTVLQRMVSMIFDIRLDSYINQRVSLFGSIITISSVFYFFRSGSYGIIPYFFFSQSINLIAVLVSIWLANKKYNYNIGQLLSYIRFNSVIYKKANGLAYSGLYVMILWILFYEIDQFAIGKFIGVEKVAIYAIALSFSTLFRSIYGILFAPFNVRANYFVGNGDEDGLKRFCLQLFCLSAPLVVLPTIAFVLVAKLFIISWVGVNYTESIELARLFALIFTLSFISYPASMILIVKVRMKEMYVIATIQPLVYWIGVLSTYSFWGLLSFGLFKFIAISIAEIYYFYILAKYLDMSLMMLFRKAFYPIMLPLLFLVIILTFAVEYLPHEKSKINLLIVLGTTGICILISFILQYFASSNIRIVIKNLIGSIIPQKG
ncbi:MAG: polysaccharide biosynthesis protein [Bacteroidota bacterium]